MQFIVNTSQVCSALDCKVMKTNSNINFLFSIVLGDNYCYNNINILLSWVQIHVPVQSPGFTLYRSDIADTHVEAMLYNYMYIQVR